MLTRGIFKKAGSVHPARGIPWQVEAERGHKFVRLPPILVIQLKRMRYDPQNFQRIKINTAVSFPSRR